MNKILQRLAGNSKGGKAKVKKGFAAMSPERRAEIASMGGKVSKRGPAKAKYEV